MVTTPIDILQGPLRGYVSMTVAKPRWATSVQIRNLGMDTQQLRYRARVTSAKAAFRRNRKAAGVLFGGRKPLLRTFDAVGVVYEPEAEFSFGAQHKAFQRREIGVVGAIARTGM